MKKRLGFMIIALPLFLAVALITLGVRTAKVREAYRDDLQNILYFHRVMALSLKLLSDAKDLETGQRGFLLTGNPSYLELYQKSLGPVVNHLQMLLSVAHQFPDILAQTEESGQILAREISILNRTVVTQESSGKGKALQIVRTGRSKKGMDKLRVTIGQTLFSLNREIFLIESRAFEDRRQLDREFVFFGSGAFLVIIIAIAIIVREIRKNDRLLRRLENESTHDELTGLPNRRFLLEWLRVSMLPDRKGDKPFCLLFLDLDHFKTVNDHLGHAAGDLVLKQVVKRFQTALREGDLLMRVGGDEFISVIMEDLDENSLDLIKKRIEDTVDYPPLLPRDFPAAFGVSIGISRYPYDGETVEELLHSADTKMYEEKLVRRQPLSPQDTKRQSPEDY